MSPEIGLPISVQVQAARENAAMDRLLADCSSDTLSLPFHVTWQADIN